MNKLSIITVNLNNISGLARTIESVEVQTWRDFEWIIVDGGSTDGSKQLIEELASRWRSDVSQLYWVSESDKGIYNAMNKGISQSLGEYLLFLNSGDWLYEETTLEQVMCKGLNEDICFGHIALHQHGGNIVTQGPTSSGFSLFGLVEHAIPHPASFIRRSLFKQYGLYDESYRIAADQEFFWRVIVKHNCMVKYLDMIISHMEDGGISHTHGDLFVEENHRLRQSTLPRLFGDDHPEFYDPKEVRKAMRLYKRLQSNPLIKLYCKLFRS